MSLRLEQIAAYCEARRGRRGGRDRSHRAPVPLRPVRADRGRPVRRRAGPAPRLHARLLGPPRPQRSRRLRRDGASRRRRPASRSSSGSRSTTTGAGWTRSPSCSPGTPSTSCSARSTGWGPGGSTTATRRAPGRVAGPPRRRRAGTPTPTAIEELAGSGACDVLAHPDLVKVTGYSPEPPRGVVGPTGRGGRLERGGGRGLLGRLAQAL